MPPGLAGRHTFCSRGATARRNDTPGSKVHRTPLDFGSAVRSPWRMDNHIAVHHGTPSRRLVLGSAAAVAVTALTAPVASAEQGHRRGRLPSRIALPVGTRPEGITSCPGATFYVGSVADGRILTGS